MTVLQRQQLRVAVMSRFVAQAYEKAGQWKLTAECKQAMGVMNRDPAQARELHGSCRAEEFGGSGCMCQCHDIITGGVVTGGSAVF